MINFSNPGEIDIRAVITMGVNVKDSPSSIGHFGTGLKYAIATLLREGQEISIYSGLIRYNFSVQLVEIRGKAFNLVHLSEHDDLSIPLGFTTELGKNWTLQHAYRELYSNMLDESGEILPTFTPQKKKTVITVKGEKFQATHEHRREFLLPASAKPICVIGDIEIYFGQSTQIFYKGIGAGSFRKPTAFTYNITSDQKLTEDRTLAELWYFEYKLTGAFAACEHPEVLSSVLWPGDGAFEHDLNFLNVTLNSMFLSLVRSRLKTNPEKINQTLKAKFYSQLPAATIEYEEYKISSQQEKELSAAIVWLEALGFHITKFHIKVVKSLGANILGLTQGGVIYLTSEVFSLYQLRETLLEEYMHLAFSVHDETRQMQNTLFNEIIRLGEKYYELKEKKES